jgi:glutamyl-tRNA synthetase
MNYKKLAEMLFPDNKLSVEEIEKKYPKRNLPKGAQVTRFAPSPTGFMHLGNFFQAFISATVARVSNGIFYLRNEDTDKKREIVGASSYVMKILFDYGIAPKEYEMKGGVTVGDYGPYYQSERIEIYKAYAKQLVSEGKAFPCFCDKADGIAEIKVQREKKFAIGLANDEKDPCRNLTMEQIEANLKEKKPFAIRLKSCGNSKNKVEFFDVLKGKISMEENSKDVVLLKSDSLPTYHFAHAIDDTLMGTTLVVRGEEWLPSTPVHLEIFNALGFEKITYLHNPLICIKEGEKKRKVSKRKDKEFAMKFYAEQGYPTDTICEYIMNLVNSGFEMWRKKNPTLAYTDYYFEPLNITASSPVLDMDKFNDVSKEIISRYSAQKCYSELLAWAREYSPENAEYLARDKEYVTKVLNIDREKPKPRKDIYKWSMFFDLFDYMFGKPESFEVEDEKKKDFKEVLKTYKKYLNLSTKEEWFDNIKKMAAVLGYATDNKDFKAAPEKYKGNVATVCEYIRVAITGRKNSPDLYEIMTLLGEKEVLERLSKFA